MSVSQMSVAVVYGGDSAEREVSIASAAQIVSAMRSRGHAVRAIDLRDGPLALEDEATLFSQGYGRALNVNDLGGQSPLRPSRLIDWLRDVDVAFLALHGGTGENGTVQTILELGGVPYTGSTPVGSAIAMDKDVSKRLYLQAEIPTARWRMAARGDHFHAESERYPLVVKPNRQGSTIGLSLVRGPEFLAKALEKAFRYDDEVMIEEFIRGRELTVGILGDRALSVGEVMVSEETVFDFETKYVPGAAREIFPAQIGEVLTEQLLEYALRAHKALKLRGYSRTDFRVTDGGSIYCLESNTLPGMTSTSLYPQSAEAVGLPFAELCERICKMALDSRC